MQARQGKGKAMARLRHGKGKDKAKTMQGKGTTIARAGARVRARQDITMRGQSNASILIPIAVL